MKLKSVDLLYLAWNRLEFTRETFTSLLANTDWRYVNTLHVYDDGSTDGTCEWLAEAVARVPRPVEFRRTQAGSPVTLFVEFIDRSAAPILAKCDSDAVYPPGWLRRSLAVLERYPDLHLLGIEAMNPVSSDPETEHGFTEAAFMSGLGLYRRSAFDGSRPQAYEKYFGLEEWQVRQGSTLKRGWINPALSVFLLDRMPTEPWRTLSDEYVRRGWQRPWPTYDPSSTLWSWRWPDRPTENAPRPISRTADNGIKRGARAAGLDQLNLSCLETPLAGYENAGLFPFPGVNVVDLKAAWPWPDGRFDHVRCWDVLPRLPDKVEAMNELWRITKPAGIIELAVPTTDGPEAFQDPTHRSYWNQRSFMYFEAGNPYRERFRDSYGIRAAWRILDQRTAETVVGPRLVLRLQAVKSQDPFAKAAVTPDVAPQSRPWLIGAMRIKNEAAHIREVLERALAVCDRILVFDDHSDDETVAICQSFGARVTVFESPYQGLDEARDKNYLLARVIAEDPEWVLWIDGDEVLERSADRRMRDAISQGSNVAAYSLRIAFVWDEPQQVRTDGLWGRFTRPSLFRLRGQAATTLSFPTTGFGGNFHCGNVPRGLTGETRQLDIRLKHYGYQTRDIRMTKYRFYSTRDPNNTAEDNYRHLAEIPGARHAPGPPRLEPWVE